MTELKFLTIADAPEDLEPLHNVLRPFELDSGVQIRLRRIDWDRAWQTLLIEALEGKGPHVAQVGSTWVATMAMLDALRVFSPNDVYTIGEVSHFLPAAWETIKLEDRPEVWAIPWTVYTFVLFYRKDLLERAGLDPQTDFSTPRAMCESFEKLSSKGIAPWTFPTLHPYADLVHIASSWVRANGGNFLRSNGREPSFAEPEASAGLMDFFELFPYIPPSLRGLSMEACTKAFASGETALLVGGVEVADELLSSPYASQELRENLGVTTLPGIPWIGGDHLAVWKNVRVDAQLEKAALDLVQFLTGRETQLQYFKSSNVLPARLDAYPDLEFSLDTTSEAVQKILKTGRPHPPLRLWWRIETFFDEMLLEIGNAVLRQPAIPASEIAKRMISEYAEKLSAIMKG